MSNIALQAGKRIAPLTRPLLSALPSALSTVKTGLLTNQ